jgi:hypothetical protein
VAVPAEEHALSSLLAGSVDPVAESAGGESERLLLRVEVVELERSQGPVITARRAAAASLLDQDPLDLAAPLCDALLGA